MGFSVNTGALAGLPQMLDRRWHSLEAGRRYLATRAVIPADQQGVLNACLAQHTRNITTLDHYLAVAAEQHVGRFSVAIGEAVTSYTRTDETSAARLDLTYPGTVEIRNRMPAQVADQALTADLFADRHNPGSRYLAPEDYRGEYELDMTALDWLSPTTMYRDLVWWVTSIAASIGLLDHPIDPLEEFCKPLSGDWAAFASCADVIACVGMEIGDDAVAIDAGAAALTRIWTGNAAGNCQASLYRLARELGRAPALLDQLAEQYRNTAEQMRSINEAMRAVITVIVDEAIDLAIDAATEGAAAPFVAPSLIGGCKRLVQAVWKARGLIRDAWEVVRAFADGSTIDLTSLGLTPVVSPLPALHAAPPTLHALLPQPL